MKQKHIKLFEEYTYPKKDNSEIDKDLVKIDELTAKIYAKKVDFKTVSDTMKDISKNEANFSDKAAASYEKLEELIRKTFGTAKARMTYNKARMTYNHNPIPPRNKRPGF